MLSRKITFAGLFSRNDHQSARSRARTKVAVNLEILESRELLNGAHPMLEQARNDSAGFRAKHFDAQHSYVISKTEFRVMNLTQGHLNASRFTQVRAGGLMFPATQSPSPKLTLLALGTPSPTSTLPTVVSNPATPVLYAAPSSPAVTLIQTPITSPPAQPGSPGLQPINASGGSAPASSASPPGSAPIVRIDVISSGPILY